MDGMWHLNAPQWTDFESSPQIPDDDYFDREHEDLEPQQQLIREEVVVEVTSVVEKSHEKLNKNLLQVPGNDEELLNEIELARRTPIKVISPKTRNKKNEKAKETTYDNVLSEAMASLQLSIKKRTRKSQNSRHTIVNSTATPTNADKMKSLVKSLSLNKGPRSTPSNPIPMWIRRTRPSENNVQENKKTPRLLRKEESQESMEQANSIERDNPQDKDSKVDKNSANTELEKPVDNVRNEDLDSKEEPEIFEDSNKPESNSDGGNEPSTNADLLPDPGDKRSSNVSQCSSNFSNNGRPARFPTSQLRRRSLTQYRRRSNKYISLAEAISKFHNQTPVRFRTVSTKNQKFGPVQKLRQSTVSATVPISPALRCKSRTRPAVLSHEERERIEIEEIRKHSVRENLARSNSAKSLTTQSSKIVVNKKPATTHLEKSSKPMENKKNWNKSKLDREITSTRVTVPSVLSTEEGIAVEHTVISNFGVPDSTAVKSTATKIVPFSFETRNKELKMKKEQKMKEIITEEEKKNKISFHARPVPAFKKPMIAQGKETGVLKTKTKTCPFSFEERDKNLIKKKENLIKNVIEEDKKARIFQAKPIPEFKPVLVRGISKENISRQQQQQSGNNVAPATSTGVQKTRISMLPVAKTGSRNCLLNLKKNLSNQENENPGINKLVRSKSVEIQKRDNCDRQISTNGVKVLTEFHLNTDKRAKERREFDERIKQKEQEIELLKKEAEIEKIKRDESERAEIRKAAETKARPMPVYKQPMVIHSDKPLTEPQSPGWSAKPKR